MIKLHSQLHRIISGIFATLLLSASLTVNVYAADKAEIESHQSIRETARLYAEQLAQEAGNTENLQVEVGQLDKRLRLAKCSVPLMAFESPNTRTAGRTTIGVKCDGDKNWKLYVSVNIKVIREVVVLKQPVTRNSQLQAADLAMLETDIAGLHQGYFTNVEALIGKFTKNAMQRGTVLTPAKVKNPLAIKKGALVTIVADLGGIQVRMKGKALKSGAVGDWISVKNVSSNRQIEGRVSGSGVIQVTL